MVATVFTLPAASSWKFADNVIGAADLAAVYTAGSVGAPGITPLPSVVIEQQLGCIYKGLSYDATYGGFASFIFLAVPTSTATTQGLLYRWKGDYTVEVVPTTTGATASGLPVALALNSVTSNASSIQYTWFLIQGRGAGLKAATIVMQPNVPLFISKATAGRVKSTASTLTSYIGMRSANTVTATGSVVPLYLNFPSCGSGI